MSTISVIDGIVNAIVAWSITVKPQTLANSFKHYKIRTSDFDKLELTREVDEENQMVIAKLSDRFDNFAILIEWILMSSLIIQMSNKSCML